MTRTRKQGRHPQPNISNADEEAIQTLGYTLQDCVASDDNEQDVYHLRRQISQLKEISLKIGDEIKDQSSLTEEMQGMFTVAQERLGKSFKRINRIYKKHSFLWSLLLSFFVFIVILYIRLYRF